MEDVFLVPPTFRSAVSKIREHAAIEPYTVDIDAVKVRFDNGEVVIVTQSFTEAQKFDVWLSPQDPIKPSQIVRNLSADETDAWLQAISFRILRVEPHYS